ncbi:hypothetical protein ZIOFF_003490 [Zingiber officinale]|uniref:DUF4283 domain-containing protein n=1 Tax=Zingiber officinale TaxID=94328 RepID=A0A8J5I8S2_ZINOF|nr:hypothetical protein ZIOFF_003490 [Zingiber officinale]
MVMPSATDPSHFPLLSTSRQTSVAGIVCSGTETTLPRASKNFEGVGEDFKPAIIYNNKPGIFYMEEEVSSLAKAFEFSLIGKFSGSRPPYAVVRQAFRNLGLSSFFNIRFLRSGYVFMHLTSSEDMARVWIRGVWFIGGVPLRIFKWTPYFSYTAESSVVPVWICFPDLPIHMFSKAMLFSAASIIGKPIKIDEATADCSRLSVARVCVEIDLLKPKIEDFWIGIGEEKRLQRVEFEKHPSYCVQCLHLGHSVEECYASGNNGKSAGGVRHWDLNLVALDGNVQRVEKQVWIQKKGISKDQATKSKFVKAQGNNFYCLADLEEEKKESAEEVVEQAVVDVDSGCRGDMDPVPAINQINTLKAGIRRDKGKTVVGFSVKEACQQVVQVNRGISLVQNQKVPILKETTGSKLAAQVSYGKAVGSGIFDMAGVERNDISKSFEDEDDSDYGEVVDSQRSSSFPLGSNVKDPLWKTSTMYIPPGVSRMVTRSKAQCDRVERRKLWDDVLAVKPEMDEFWLVGGDFNVISDIIEHSAGSLAKPGATNEFNNFIMLAELLDAGFVGDRFTWTNGKVWKRLDRVLVSTYWGDQKGLHSGFGLQKFQFKLKRLKTHLKWWNVEVFGNIFENVKKAEEDFELAEKAFDRSPTMENKIYMAKCQASLFHILDMEEMFWKQKAAMKWFGESERNTKFFHNLVRKRRMASRIFRIWDEGVCLEDNNLIQTSGVRFFEDLLTGEDFECDSVGMDIIPQLVSLEENQVLSALPSIEELKRVVWEISEDNAAGPDGFSAAFYAIYMSKLYCGGASPCVVPLQRNASPCWRRLVKLRNYGENNIGWIIGNGEINFWYDNWLDSGPLYLFCPIVGNPDSRVLDFICNLSWNVNELQSCVPEQIVDEIKEVALPGGISGEAENVEEAVQNGVRDCIVWKPSLDGKFTMKTAWKSIRKDQQQAGVGQQQAVWSKLIFPNISVFVWHFLRKRLPVDEVLQRRGVYLASKCYCCDFVESWDHLFLVFENWRSGQSWSYGGHVIWFLWCARNDAKHRGIRMVAKKIIWNVSQYIISGIDAGIIKPGHWKGFIMVAQNLGLLVKPRTVNTISVVTWKKPKVGWFKLNTDGCSKGNPGLSSFGVIIRDHGGNVMMVKYGLIRRGSNVRAELMAILILKGLELCVEKQFFPIWLEYGFFHVYREANVAADHIANQAFISLVDDGLNDPLDLYTDRICYNHEIDKELHGICNLDKSGLPYIRFSSKPGWNFLWNSFGSNGFFALVYFSLEVFKKKSWLKSIGCDINAGIHLAGCFLLGFLHYYRDHCAMNEGAEGQAFGIPSVTGSQLIADGSNGDVAVDSSISTSEDFMDFAELCFRKCFTWASGECHVADLGRDPYTIAHHQLLAHTAAVALFRDKFKNESQMLKGSFNFIGINYDTSLYAYSNHPTADANPNFYSDQHAIQTGKSDGVLIGLKAASDWLLIYPLGLKQLLFHVKTKYNNPVVYITDLGCSIAYRWDCTLVRPLPRYISSEFTVVQEKDKGSEGGKILVWSYQLYCKWDELWSRGFSDALVVLALFLKIKERELKLSNHVTHSSSTILLPKKSRLLVFNSRLADISSVYLGKGKRKRSIARNCQLPLAAVPIDTHQSMLVLVVLLLTFLAVHAIQHRPSTIWAPLSLKIRTSGRISSF